MNRLLWTLFLLLGLGAESYAAVADRYAAKSVLDSGKWVKIQVSETGMYKLSAADIKKMGFSNPDNVAIYGYGGWPLDENFSNTYIDDLPEVSTYHKDNNIIFYARGPIKWEYSESEGFKHTNNPYSTYGTYFVTEKSEAAKVMQIAQAVSSTTLDINTFDNYYLWEKDQVSVNSSGRELYGESFEYNTSQDFTVSIPGITSDDGLATMSFIAKSPTIASSVVLSINSTNILSLSISKSANTGNAYYTVAVEGRDNAVWKGDKSESMKVNIQYSTSGHKNARLNYFVLQSKRTLKNYDAFTQFRSLAARNNASRFTVGSSTSSTLIFDVTDPVTPEQMTTELNGEELSFGIPASSELHEFVAVEPSKLKSPTIMGTIANQNLHGLEQQDMIILAKSSFAEDAERLAEAHRTRDNLTVKVVTPEAVYNEFSSGTPDASAYRRFMKMFYDRKTSDSDAPKYLLLFGDGSFDNRQLTSNWKQIDMSNMLLTYQTENSLTEFSYVVDDYFGMLDDADNEKVLANRKVNIGIGRFPVRTVTQATQAVDKIIGYMDNKEPGSWKNNLCFMADDGSSLDNFSQEHMQQADSLATYLNTYHPEFLVNKLYYDAYKKSQTTGDGTYPDVKLKLDKLLKDGLLLLNYTGHGSTLGLSQEYIIKQTDIQQSTYTKLPAWVTATCDFTRFDDLSTSSGEDVFLHPTSGGIALFTTTRVAYSPYNAYINSSLVRNLFEKKDGVRRTLGDVIKEMKCALVNNAPTSIYKLGFCLIGDPALTLGYPEYNLHVTKVNDEDAYGEAIPFRALDKITVEGIVRDGDGIEKSDYSGILYPTVKDSRIRVTCLNNNWTSDTRDPFEYDDYPNTIYVGNDSIRNGQFKFTFIVPKDISYANLFGKMNLYSYDSTSGIEGQGNFDNFIVGGTGEEIEPDTIGPEIRQLYLNDTTFVDGGSVNTTPYFVVRLWDESGVSIAGSSIGHDIMLVIDDNMSLAYNLNNYYSMITGSEGEGIVQFSIPQLSAGIHTAEFWVWDIYNNSTVRTFTFKVEEGLRPFLLDVVATPVPARENVTFHLTHNRPESRMKVGIMVYDLAGRLMWKHEEEGASALFNSYDITWDLTKSGSILRPGVYLYRAAISADNSKEASKTKKLIILGK